MKIPSKGINKKSSLNLDMLKEKNTKNNFNIEISNMFEQLHLEECIQIDEDEEVQRVVDKKWEGFKNGVQTTLKSLLPRRGKRKVPDWMTSEILGMMEERRSYQNTDQTHYKQIHKRITAACREAKETWLGKQCEDVEKLKRQHELKELHVKVKELTGKRKKEESTCIKDKEGNILFDKEDIEKRWIEYIQQLYDEDRGGSPAFNKDEGLDIMEEEVSKAITSMKNGKASGPDEIPVEALKAMDESNTAYLTKLCNLIYKNGHIPDDLLLSVFIPIPKKAGAQLCTQFRTISLMSHITKILLKVIQQRISAAVNREISPNQSGFRPGVGTREGIFNLRVTCERALDARKTVYACFIDYSKAFDCVSHIQLMKVMEEIGIMGRDLHFISNLYWNQSGVVRTGNGISESSFPIKRGVRQGCVLSPCLFNLYVERIFRETQDLRGLKIGGININNLRYADDTVLLAESEEDLKNLLLAVNREGEKFGMFVNPLKTKLMVISASQPVKMKIKLNDVHLEQVESFVYLGHLVTEDGKCEREINRRIEIARGAFEGLNKLLTSRKLSLDTRRRLSHCYVWSTLLYGAETWTVSDKMLKKLAAFELWTYRRMLNITWKDKVKNDEVLRRAGTVRLLVDDVKRRKLQFFGHLMRKEGFQRLILEGRIEGKRGAGRPRNSWSGDIKRWCSRSYGDCVRLAQCRGRWRSMNAKLLGAEDTHR